MISQRSLRVSAIGAMRSHNELALKEAFRTGKQTAFLSHSHEDAQLAEGVQAFLQEQGWDVYIDWQDTAMPATPTETTAKKIQERINRATWFLFLATAHSMSSRWCPWEIGYADGVKELSRIIVLPTRDYSNKEYGSEYLKLYRHVKTDSFGRQVLFEAGGMGSRSLGQLRG
ncbi:MAG: toll/interleukin-1 receptor domain-containing protein [Pseudomonadota bacterium]